jgi:3-oxoacyl-[acyl-carrier-protein] synthase II
MGLANSLVVPTVNLETPGDGCDLRYSPETPMSLRQRAVLSNSFGFGGLNAAIVLRAA